MAVTTHYLHSHSDGLQSNEAGHSSKPNSVKNAKQRSKLPVFTFSSRTGEVEKKKKDKTNNKKKNLTGKRLHTFSQRESGVWDWL